MLKNRLFLRTAHSSSRGGFTLVELLVVIGIIAILAGVALGPITNGIKQAQHNAAMQTGRQIGQMCFSYATDNTTNGGQYPSGTTALIIAQSLINSNYASDPSVFGVTQQSGFTKATTSGSTVTLVAHSVSWSFTIAADGTSGISSTTSDLIPLVYFNNGFGVAVTSAFPVTPGTQQNVAYGSNSPFAGDGAAIFFKGNNAVYEKAGSGGSPSGDVPFISANCTDTTTYIVAP